VRLQTQRGAAAPLFHVNGQVTSFAQAKPHCFGAESCTLVVLQHTSSGCAAHLSAMGGQSNLLMLLFLNIF
ncbi:hypothetical protein V6O07_16430, partial [Arthrospira platensis SPKY2]